VVSYQKDPVSGKPTPNPVTGDSSLPGLQEDARAYLAPRFFLLTRYRLTRMMETNRPPVTATAMMAPMIPPKSDELLVAKFLEGTGEVVFLGAWVVLETEGLPVFTITAALGLGVDGETIGVVCAGVPEG
jgi:hypothetical protein